MSNAPSDTAITIIDADTGPRIALYEALYSIEGMTCAACTGKVQETIEALPGVKQVSVALMTNSATVQFEGLKEDAAKVVDEIEDIGFDCRLEDIKECGIPGAAKTVERTAMIKIEGMRSGECPAKVLDALTTSFQDRIIVNKEPTLADPVIQITYLPAPPEFTIRHIISRINASDPGFVATVYHPPTIEERSREIQQKDFKKLAIRLIICIIIAIPTFLIGIVWMSLVPSTNPVRSYFEQPMWAGRANRLEWALFFLATPVQFFIADVFHIKAFKELRAIWRPGSSVPILKRFYKFGSMSLLISLGVSIAYFSSIGLLAVAARSSGDSMGHHTTYFDSTVFLTMFLLLGKCLEAYSKSKTADAVSMLGKLRPSEALLLVDESAKQGRHMESASRGIKRIPVEMLEVGDTILVQNGGSPPADGLISVGQTKFDESSLTGEAKPVIKNVGDEVFAGTINRGNAVNVVIDAVDGESMLDQIVKVVREGQTRKAPIERVADMITGYFVPVVTLIAITTWVVWLSLGLTGHLPPQYLDVDQGGWPVWSLGFAISVFVVACPCGIGLAAPTALFVGSGLAAKYGILAKGGGEAFQEASMLNVIVFDKTGTLTEGGEPRVTDEKVFEHLDGGMVYSVAMKLEEASSHPLARAVLGFCEGKPRTIRTAVGGSGDVEEIPGRGMKGIINVEGSEGSSLSYEAIIGNEAFMAESGVPPLDGVVDALLHSWKSKGKSVVLLAMRPITTTSPTSVDPLPSSQFTLSAIFSATDPIRKESRAVVNYLQTNLHLQVWLISGDNHTTTHSVAAQVGIPLTNVIASVLPHEKALHVRRLQQLPPPPGSRGNAKRNIVAMVGDGINDAPALSTSDVAIAIGSGSDIALSTSSFVLLNSDLWGVVRLVHLSRKVLSRVRWNFAWACVYNIIAVPVAAGVLYPVGMRGGMGHAVGSGGSRIRLDPAWASLAMALSSVSVICSSLMLRTRWWGVGFRPVEGSGSSSGSGGEGWRRDEKEGKDGKGKSLVEERREEEGLVV
ncbi:Cu-transporting P-type ATPase [Peziza echinospora]|nr:Cu-transporting P-type ATPase [Peziza echinospora]